MCILVHFQHCSIVVRRNATIPLDTVLWHPLAPRVQPKLILLLLDGLRWDKYGLDLPNLHKVEEYGVKARWMNGVFPTMSSPSMYSIATGLYPESHGVIHNLYFNSTTKERTYGYAEALNLTEYFDTGVDPIWVTAMQAGLRVGNIMYPGAQEFVKGVIPEKVVPSTSYFWLNYKMKDRIDDTISWLKDEALDLVLLYFDDPDETLHKYGIGHPRTIARLQEVDENIGYLFQKLGEAEIADHTDVIIASDHGHMNVDLKKKISLYDYIDPSDVDFIICDYGPTFQLQPVKGKETEVYETLKNAHPALYVYRKEEFPERFHYGNHPRNLPILGFVDPGWSLHTIFNERNVLASDHGYDNKWMVMKSSFYARGPTFREGYLAEPIDSVDIYNLMCDILQLEPAKNNGTRSHYEDMIASVAPSVGLSCPLMVIVGFRAVLVVIGGF